MSTTDCATTEKRRRGNALNRRVGILRGVILKSVTEDDAREVARVVADRAKGGDMEAADVFLKTFCVRARMR